MKRPVALVISSLSLLFCIACGSSDSSPPPTDSQDFSLQLELTTGEIIAPVTYEYPRCPEGADYAGGSNCIEDGDFGWNNGVPGQTLDYLQTAQFILEPHQTPHRLSVRDNTGNANCMLAYFQGPSTQNSDAFARFTLGFDDPNTSYVVPTGKLSVDTPLHLTLIPVNTTAGTCANPGVDAQADRILAAWISVRPAKEIPAPGEIVCNLHSGMDFSQDVVDGNCTISAPQWRLDSTYRRVVYTGTLWDMLATPQTKISINLADDLSLPVPINSAYAAFYLDPGTQDSDCQQAVDRMNAGQAPENDACKVTVQAGPLFTQPSSAQFSINGFGRISGFGVLQDFPVNTQVPLPAGSGAIQIFQNYAEFRIRSYLIGLSSNHPSTDPINNPAINVENVTVGWTAKLGYGSVELNSEYLGLENPPTPPEAPYEQAVRMHDYKQVGSWVGQSDGPEVMGHNSLIEYGYLHVADDSIKVSAQNVDFKQITVIKGNSGGVVNLGSYGKNRLVDGSIAEEIWVPRITHSKSAGNGALGLVISRTCPSNQSLAGAQVRNLYVPSLGGEGLPNAISGLVRLGVTHCDIPPLTSRFTIGNIDFLQWQVEIQPQVESVLYADQVVNQSGQDVLVTWDKVRFYDPNQPIVPANAVVFYPDSVEPGYYICAQDVASLNRCYSTTAQGQGNLSVNLVYSSSGGAPLPPDGTAVYPGGP